jgi:hypothetical protein
MPNKFTYQVIKDTTEHTVIKLTGSFDGSTNEDNAHRIQANTLYGALDANNVPLRSHLSLSNTAKPYYGLTVNRVWYDTWPYEGDVELYWTSDDPQTILLMNGNGEYDGNGNWVTIPNPNTAIANTNGDIGIKSRLAPNCNTSSYTIVIELRKLNEYYQRGQFNDPAAFNYPPYGLTPN